MAITKNSGRQAALVASLLISFADITPAGTYDAIDLPVGATVIGGEIITDTGVTGGGLSAATVSLGDSSSATRYLSASSVFTTGARAALTLSGYKHTSSNNLLKAVVAFTGGTTPTAGSIRINVEYIVDGRVQTSQG